MKRSSASIILCFILIFTSVINVSAAEGKSENIYISYGENYENKETGEYFRWITYTTARGTIAKSFEFRIRSSISSDKFTIDSTRVIVEANAHVEDAYGSHLSAYAGHGYQITISKLFSSKNLYFDVDGTESGTISGLNSGSKYTITITNNDYLPSIYYLVGSGTVVND